MAEAFNPVPIGTISKNSMDEVRVTLDQFRGAHLVDIRIFSAFTAAKIPMATKKGVSLKVDLLPDLVKVLTEAEAKARALGLIGGDE